MDTVRTVFADPLPNVTLLTMATRPRSDGERQPWFCLASRAVDIPSNAIKRLMVTFRLRSESVSALDRHPSRMIKQRLLPMYRCYFTQHGQVEDGYNLDVSTLDAAIATGRKILADELDLDRCNGLEIWLDRALLYRFSA